MLLLQIALSTLLLTPAHADIYGPTGPTPLVTGNGFGLAVYSLEKKAVTKFYAHPYRFETPDPANSLSEGIETANLLTNLTWDRDTDGHATYLKQSHIVAVEKASARQYFFMPFGLLHNAFVAITKDDAGCLQPSWTNPVLEETRKGRALVLRFQGIKERVLAYPLGRAANPRYENHCFAGARGWALLSLEEGEDSQTALQQVLTWAGENSVLGLVTREYDEFEKWRVAPKIELQSKRERNLWRQQETILRMAQSREPNRANRFSNGMIVASLPEGMWFVTWVRDMAYATLALLRMGHQAEARAALASYFNSQPTGLQQNDVRGFPYQISVVRYFGNGAEEPFFTMEGATNIEFDNWGLVLMVLSEYYEKYHDRSLLNAPTWRGESVYEVARDYIAKPLVGNLDPFGSGKIVSADTSAWEEYQPDKKHFVFSSAGAWAGLQTFGHVAAVMNDPATAAFLQTESAALARGVPEAFAQDGFLAGTQERNAKNVVDSAALEALNFGVLNSRDLIRGTISASSVLRVGSGGIRRVRGDTPYERHEFVFSDISLARNYLRLGEQKNSAPLIDTIVERSAGDNYFVPEMYVSEPDKFFPGKIGTPTGSIPMVGYGAGAVLLYFMERASLRE